eukprot:TRINITY_DN20083_c0_g1_i1.p1 TRINITY_DN20083_c0_g1~~TRINITY_DN20083_c0_g1_i1.p1  ORF type:complete len:499 (-),score=66.37 TRINITY_DN20083_c0_g1_i1:66-1541(-)
MGKEAVAGLKASGKSDARPILTESVQSLAQYIKTKKISSEELVQTFIDQIQAVNPYINAVVHTRFEEALQEARACDDRLQRTDDPSSLPPLFGVPCSIKECFALTGMPNASGLLSRKDVRSERDATVVARLRKAGAIPLGVTNTSELCMWMESYNKVYGRTNNPYDLRRTCGGSSGGEAAIVAACGAPFGLGSDIGGSIRMPAFFNGVFGHKATGTLVSNEGQFPCSVGEAQNYLSTGPICRYASDLMPLLRLMTDKPIADEKSVDIKKLRILYGDPKYLLAFAPSPELKAAQLKAVEHLRECGATVEAVDLSFLRHALSVWSNSIASSGGPTFKEMLENGEKSMSPVFEMIKWAFQFGTRDHTFPAIGLAAVESLTKLTPKRAARFVELGKKLKAQLSELLGDDGVLIIPTYPRVAQIHGEALTLPTNWIHTGCWNVLEVPVTAVPMGLNPHGVPLGIQIVSNHFNDHITIAVAVELDSRVAGWVAPRST